VDGNSAWIGSSIDQSTNTDFFPIGATVITLVRDLGGARQDIMHSESEIFSLWARPARISPLCRKPWSKAATSTFGKNEFADIHSWINDKIVHHSN
jgi:hypothetical protein